MKWKASLFAAAIIAGLAAGFGGKSYLGIKTRYACFSKHCFYIVVHPRWW